MMTYTNYEVIIAAASVLILEKTRARENSGPSFEAGQVKGEYV